MSSLARTMLSCLIVLSCGWQSGTAFGGECSRPARLMGRVELFFGTTLADGQALADQDWQKFVDEEVTPRFPEGLTEILGRGQWRRPDGVITHEPSRLLLIWYSPATNKDADIEAIREAYKTRFKQLSVMRVDGVNCVSF
jgi:Protein of unknown function (DUF3574)